MPSTVKKGRRRSRGGKSNWSTDLLLDATAPQDSFARFLINHRRRGAAFIRDFVPAKHSSQLRLETIEFQETGFIHDNLQTSVADLLAKIQRVDDGGAPFIYSLIEFKSRLDRYAPLQIEGYKVRIWANYAGGEAERLQNLPPILVILASLGVNPWPGPLSLHETIKGNEQLYECATWSGYLPVDFATIEVDRVKWSDRELMVGVIAVQHSRRDLDDLMAVLVRLYENLDPDSDLVVPLAHYILLTYIGVTVEMLRKACAVAHHKLGGDAVEFAADHLKAEGEAKGLAKGLAKGKAEGKVESLIAVLKARFGKLPSEVAKRVGALSESELSSLIPKAATASSLDALFGGTGGNGRTPA